MTLSISIVFAVIAGLLAGAAATWMMMRSLQRAHVETIAERLKSELHETNARIAQTQRDTFLSLANERFSAVVAPVAQKLSEFDALVKAIEKDRIGAYEGLRDDPDGWLGVVIEYPA